MKEWYYALNDQQIGPVTGAELRQLQREGTISALTLVWSPQLSNWTQLVAVPASLLPPAPPQSVPDAVQSVMAAPVRTAPRAYQIEFRGRAGEYFGIWIVNVVLTVLTLGIYAAWAKVRNRRYFFGNTLLDGSPFDFTGNPVAILKGNLIFGGLFILSSLTASLPAVSLVVSLLFALMVPWLIYRALHFRAHYTTHRGVRFNHRGTAGESYAVYFWLPIAAIFTLGFLFPYVIFRQRKFSLGNFGWGNQAANPVFQPGAIYKIWFKAFGLSMLVLLLIAGGMALAMPLLIPKIKTQLDREFAPSISKMTRYFAADSITSRAVRKNTTASDDDDIDSRRERARRTMHDTGFIIGQVVGQFIFIVLFLVVQLYFSTRVTNYTLGHTQWGTLGNIESTLRARDIFWLRLSNALAILCTAGLLIPWAKIRMARYRASRTRFIAVGDLDAVAQSSGAGTSAIGDSAADVFDIDIGF